MIMALHKVPPGFKEIGPVEAVGVWANVRFGGVPRAPKPHGGMLRNVGEDDNNQSAVWAYVEIAITGEAAADAWVTAAYWAEYLGLEGHEIVRRVQWPLSRNPELPEMLVRDLIAHVSRRMDDTPLFVLAGGDF